MSAHAAPAPWSYPHIVRAHVVDKHVVDVGTGGGEVFLALATTLATGIGVDSTPSMVKTAQRNAATARVTNVSFVLGTASALGVPD